MKQLMIVCLLCNLLPGLGMANGQTFSGKSGAPVRSPAVLQKSRTILVLLDMSSPYRNYQTALAQLVAAAGNLGPGDRMQVMLVAGEFSPENNRYLTVTMPVVDAKVFLATKNMQIWRQNQAKLDAAWKLVETNAKDTVLNLQKLHSRNKSKVTNLWGALKYGALWLRDAETDEKILVIASDLEQDFGHKRTTDPPPALLDFKSVRARLLWVTYNENRWNGMESHWRQYFQQCGAAEFKMLDSGRSLPAIAIEASSVPRQVPDWRGKESQ